MFKNKGFASFALIIIAVLVLGGGYWMWQGNKVGEINNNEPRDLPMSTNNGGDSISLQAELERVYTEYREAVLKKDVETVIKLMPGKLGDDKTLAERSREEAIKDGLDTFCLPVGKSFYIGRFKQIEPVVTGCTIDTLCERVNESTAENGHPDAVDRFTWPTPTKVQRELLRKLIAASIVEVCGQPPLYRIEDIEVYTVPEEQK